jgi:hypothetical protein
MHALRDTLVHAFGGNKLPGTTRTDFPSPARPGRLGGPPPATRVFPPDVLDDADRCLTAEILHQLPPTGRARANPRVGKGKMSVYQVKHPHHRNAPIIEHRPIIATLK